MVILRLLIIIFIFDEIQCKKYPKNIHLALHGYNILTGTQYPFNDTTYHWKKDKSYAPYALFKKKYQKV